MAVIAGNWKMHMGPQQARTFLTGLDVAEVPEHHDLLIFPPALTVAAVVSDPARDPRVRVGVQNIHWEDQGAYTGEVSAAMAAESGATFALIGHSERRHVFGESDEEVALKVGSACRHGLVPVVCVGETLEERRAGRVDEVILRQLGAALEAFTEDARVLLAYEPVWAIGTGETATPADASAAHDTLRRRLTDALGPVKAREVAILYGGSVKPGNAAELLGAAEVDGVLVGGASLDPESFTQIASAAS
jgi:triosephosphate isomerase